MQDQQPADLQQAKLIISLKNDQINSLNNKMKMIEKKSNIKVTQVSYQLQQEKYKVQKIQKQLEKNKQIHSLENNKLLEQVKLQKQQNNKIRQLLNDKEKQLKQMQRSLKAQIYEKELAAQKYKENFQRISKQIHQYQTLLPLKTIMQEGNYTSYMQVPTYTQLKQMIKNQEEEIKKFQKKLDQYKADTLSTMQQSFSKLSSYEQAMTQLHLKNEQLQIIAKQKQELYEYKNNQFLQKKFLLNQVTALSHQKIDQLNNEIQYLRNSIQDYERQSINFKENRAEYENSLKFVFDLTAEFQAKQQNYLRKLQNLDEQLRLANQSQKSIKHYYQLQIQKLKQNTYNLQSNIRQEKNNNENKQIIILQIGNSLKTIQRQLNQQKQQNERLKKQINQIKKQKSQLNQQFIEKQAFYKNSIDSLNQQLQFLRSINVGQNNQHSFNLDQQSPRNSYQKKRKKSLLDQINQVQNIQIINYQQLYQNALKKHNIFIKEMFKMIKKANHSLSQKIK